MRRIINKIGQLFLIVMTINVYGQTNDFSLPDIIPPTPNASSMLIENNFTTNYYSGSVNVSFPIYNINCKGIELNVGLNYTGGNGIKVQEQATWVGLGWTLNYGGVVSRTIRGLADDRSNGYMHTSDLPAVETQNGVVANLQDFINIGNNSVDGEPDMFNYSFGGNSGSFFINKQKQVVEKPLSNNKITIISGGYLNQEIKGFEITTSAGITYRFIEEEKSRSRKIGSTESDVNFYTTSWYLSEIKNYNNTATVSFQYQSFNGISTVDECPYSIIDPDMLPLVDDYFYQENIIESAKRIEKITFPNGEIEFKKNSTYRLDVKNDYALDEIIIRNDFGDVKSYRLKYSYFTPVGAIPFTSVNDEEYSDKRLKLDEIWLHGSDGVSEQCVRKFSYNEEVSLPNRNSKAKDHWGYYNGVTSNQSLEPSYFIEYNTGYYGVDHVQEEIGESDRNPNFYYGKAGILVKIEYPTGGSAIFEYEGHDTSDENKFLPNDFVYGSVNFDFMPYKANVDIIAIQNPFVRVYAGSVFSFSETCYANISFENTLTNEKYYITLNKAQGVESVYVPSGNYKIQMSLVDKFGGCVFPDVDPLGVHISWQNEIYKKKKDVGGVRIKSYTNVTDGKQIKKTFSYEDIDGFSTGKMVTLPEYGLLIPWPTIDGSLPPNNSVQFYRTISTSIPLNLTKGNHIGYSKIIEKTVDEYGVPNGKKEYYYSTVDDFPDSRAGWYDMPEDIDGTFTVSDMIKTHQLFKIDSRDFLRGLPIKEVIYSYENNQWSKCLEKLNFYDIYTYWPEWGINSGSFYNYNYYYKDHVLGLVVKNEINSDGGFAGGSFNYYRSYTGWQELKRNISISYVKDNRLVDTVSYYYNHSNNKTPYYQLSRTEKKLSNGDLLSIEYIYPYNQNLLTGANLVPIQGLLGKNVLIPIQIQQKENGTIKETIRTNYRDENDLLMIDNEEYAVSDNTLEVKLRYEKYDDRGNVLTLRKENDIAISYVWGYNQSYPVAKLENATYEDVNSVLGASYYLGTAGLTDSQKNSLVTNLPNSQVTTYSYKPLVGLSSQTDPNGVTTHYMYDTFSRLIEVRNHDNHLIQAFDYHYAEKSNLTVSSNSLHFEGGTCNKNLTITSNVNWTIQNSSSWISVNPLNGSGNVIVIISCSENASTNSRNGVIQVTGGGITQSISITQDAGIVTPFIDPSPAYVHFQPDGGSSIISLLSNVNWQVTASASWIVVSPTSGSNNSNITIQCGSYPSSRTRTGTITISGGGVSKMINVKQSQIGVTPD
ncbi:BACON domain-containing protein [Marinifilum fragile]|uniref:BACON domain-containing protein n=1 Tax=Marinifilum fragile TaxID=570161 RepID=UPI002AAAA5F1|nr:BACON domain-containing protein [Marinifilum fragile]